MFLEETEHQKLMKSVDLIFHLFSQHMPGGRGRFWDTLYILRCSLWCVFTIQRLFAKILWQSERHWRHFNMWRRSGFMVHAIVTGAINGEWKLLLPDVCLSRMTTTLTDCRHYSYVLHWEAAAGSHTYFGHQHLCVLAWLHGWNDHLNVILSLNILLNLKFSRVPIFVNFTNWLNSQN